jgi:nucleoid-associated protein EbfC
MNMSDIVKQVQEFQQNLSAVQEELANKTVTGASGGDMVTVVVNGKCEVVQLSIEPALVAQGDVQMLQDLVKAAINDGMTKARDLGKQEMGRLTGGLNIPGLF